MTPYSTLPAEPGPTPAKNRLDVASGTVYVSEIFKCRD